MIENWISNEQNDQSPNILDSGLISSENLSPVTLRIPYRLYKTSLHMLIRAVVNFDDKKGLIFLSISYNPLKAIIISTVRGFLNALIFVLPIVFFSHSNKIYFVLAGLIISVCFFIALHLKIQKFGEKYLPELVRKHMHVRR